MIELGNLKEIYEITVKDLDDLPAFFEDLPESDIDPNIPVTGSASTELKDVSGDNVREVREDHGCPAFFDDLQESNTEHDAPVRSITIGSFTDPESGEMFEVTLEVDTSDMERYTSDKPIMAERESETGSKSVESGEGYETPSKNDAGKTSLTEDDKTFIKAETGWSDEIVDAIESMEQYEIYKSADLHAGEVNGRKCLLKDIDLDYVDPKTGKTNRELMAEGKSPVDVKTGEKIELHHMGQNFDGPFAELAENSEHGDGNHKTLHMSNEGSWRNDPAQKNQYQREKCHYWKTRAQGEM